MDDYFTAGEIKKTNLDLADKLAGQLIDGAGAAGDDKGQVCLYAMAALVASMTDQLCNDIKRAADDLIKNMGE